MTAERKAEIEAKVEEEDDLEVEVIDLRCLTPLDREAILESVKGTNKVLIK